MSVFLWVISWENFPHKFPTNVWQHLSKSPLNSSRDYVSKDSHVWRVNFPLLPSGKCDNNYYNPCLILGRGVPLHKTFLTKFANPG